MEGEPTLPDVRRTGARRHGEWPDRAALLARPLDGRVPAHTLCAAHHQELGDLLLAQAPPVPRRGESGTSVVPAADAWLQARTVRLRLPESLAMPGACGDDLAEVEVVV